MFGRLHTWSTVVTSYKLTRSKLSGSICDRNDLPRSNVSLKKSDWNPKICQKNSHKIMVVWHYKKHYNVY